MNQMRQELLDFGVTPEQCDTKYREHKDNISYWENRKQRVQLCVRGYGIYGVVKKFILENIDENIKHERGQQMKWKMYYDCLIGKVKSRNSIDDYDIEAAKAISIVPYIESMITLHKAGQMYMGKCPFHKDDTASFMVKNNTYYCFGCGKHGDTISWVMYQSGVGFKDAVLSLVGRS